MDIARREFFRLGGGAAAGAALAACGQGGREFTRGNLPDGLDSTDLALPIAKLGDVPDSVHLLKRASWGVNQASLDELERSGLNAWLSAQLNFRGLDDAAVEAEVAQRWTTLAMSGCELSQLQDEGRVMRELREATIFRRVFSPRQLFEVMVDFWTDHFTVYHGDGLARIAKTLEDRDVIRANAMGQFRDMLHGSARSAAMLEYLDNRRSSKKHPNENYARELMELHTLGVDGGYTETDIQEVARALTGWTVFLRDGDLLCQQDDHLSFVFNANAHDVDEKTVLGQLLPAGRGIEDGNDVLNMLVDHPSTARFIASKLVRRFVADEPDEALVEVVAAQWGQDGDISAMLAVLFASPQFWRAKNLKMSRPQEFAIATVRALDPEMDDEFSLLDLLRSSGLIDQYAMLGFNRIEQLPDVNAGTFEPLENLVADPSYEGPNTDSTLNRTGHVPFQWPTPDGYPDEATYWANTNGMLERWKFAFGAAVQSRGSVTNAEYLAEGASTPREVVEQLSQRLLFRELSAADKRVLLEAAQRRGQAGLDEAFPGGRHKPTAIDVMALLLSAPYGQVR